jgi:hypothetical protein
VSETASSSLKVSLALGVSLLLTAAGLAAIADAGLLIRRSSAAADAAARETATEELNRLNAERTEAEEERGHFHAARRQR